MHILNLEDNIFKHRAICRAIERGSFANVEIECVGNLESGVSKIEGSLKKGKPYDLIITDMWYPLEKGGDDNNSGAELIAMSIEKGWRIPIILCSSIRYRFPGILGTVHYSENADWESELVKLMRKI